LRSVCQSRTAEIGRSDAPSQRESNRRRVEFP
jgi:hypothetical protein